MSRRRIPFGLEALAGDAQALAVKFESADSLVEALVAWWKRVLVGAPTTNKVECTVGLTGLAATAPEDTSVLSVAGIQEALAPLGIEPKLFAAMVESVEGQRASRWASVEAGAAFILLARALGAASVAFGATSGMLERAFVIAHEKQLPPDVLEDGIVEAIKSDTVEAREAWTEMLAQVSERVADYFDAWDFEDEAALVEEEATRWRANDDPLAVLNTLPGFSGRIDHRVSTRLAILFRLDGGAWCRALDRIPAPALKDSILGRVNLLDEPECLTQALLSAAPSADRDGRWTRSTAIILLANAVVDCIAAIDRDLDMRWRCATDEAIRSVALSERETFRSGRAVGLLSERFVELAQRPDGLTVLRWLLPRFIGLIRSEEAMGRDAFRSAPAVDGIAAVVAACSPAEVLKLLHMEVDIDRESDVARFDRVTGVALVFVNMLSQSFEFAEPTVTTGMADQLWSCLEALLVRGDEELAGVLTRSQARIPPWPARIFGTVLARTSEPARKWADAFGACGGQRRRWTFGHGNYHDGIFSQFLIVTGFSGVSSSSSTEIFGRSSRQALLHDLFSQGLALWLACPNQTISETTIAWGLSGVRNLFEPDHLSVLQSFVRRMAPSADGTSIAAFAMWKSGISLRDVVEIFRTSNIPLRTSIERANTPESILDGVASKVPPHIAELVRAFQELDGEVAATAKLRI